MESGQPRECWKIGQEIQHPRGTNMSRIYTLLKSSRYYRGLLEEMKGTEKARMEETLLTFNIEEVWHRLSC